MFTTRHILPSAATVEAFNRGLLETEKVLLGSPACTLSRLFEEVGRVVADERRPISPVGRKLLLEQLVRERYCEGHGYFARHWEFPGFIGTLDRFIGELKQACLTPAAFAAVAAAETAGGRLRELAELFALYDRELAARGLMDDHDREQAAITHLRGGAPLPESLVGVDTLLVRGIYDFTPLQLALLVALSRRLRVVLRLPYGPGREQLYAYVERTADTIEALDNNELQLETEFVEPQGPLLTPLLRALFDRQEPSVPPGALSLVAAPGAYRECEEIGRRIRALLETGVSPASIAVLFRDTETYGAMMEDVCRRFRIPVSYRRGSPLFASPLARVCLAPFTVVAARFSREALLELWKSTYVDLASHGVHGDEVEQTLLDLRYQDESLGTVEQVLERRIARLKRHGKPHDREERVLRRLGPLLAELRRFRGSRTAREFVTLLEKFIAAHRIYPRGIQAADLRVLKRDASAITGLQQLLRDLERDLAVIGLDQARFSPAEFASLLRQGMDGRFLAGEKGAGVAIMNFHDARGLSFPHVFVGGLNEGICPAVPTPHPLFKEEEKLRCNRLRGARLFRAEGEKSREEPLLFYLAVGCAEHSLTLSYAYADSRGNVLLRSPFLEELLDAVPLAEERVPLNRITPELDRCLEREELLNTLALQGHLGLPLEDAEGLAPVLARIAATAAIEAQRELFFNAEGKGVRSALSSPHTGTFRRPDLAARLDAFYAVSPGNRFAPTMLEEYGGCPFRYFLRRHLRLAPLELPERELAAKDEGSLVHEVLRACGERLAREGRFPVTDLVAALAVVTEEAQAVFARWERDRFTGGPLLWEVKQEKLLAILGEWLRGEACETSTLLPRLFEHTIEDLEVEDGESARFFLTGKIDRVDVAEASGSVRVVDYKLSGNSQKYAGFLKKEALGVTSFQMPVYLLAAARELTRSCPVPFDHFIARYWLLKRGGCRDRDFRTAKEDFTGFFATSRDERAAGGDGNFLNRLCATVRSVRQGDFQITPRGCQQCDFTAVCRYVETFAPEA